MNKLAESLIGGVIMDVTTPDQAKIAEDAGACAVMALHRVPADIKEEGGVARMVDPQLALNIMDAVTIPVMAKCRIGHTAEALILQEIGIDFIDESEVLTPADMDHINKFDFKTPFVCGCVDLRQAVLRISEGAAMIRTKGEAGTGNVYEAVIHMKRITRGIENLTGNVVDVYEEIRNLGKLPVPNFAAGGIATPADAVLMMLLGADGVFVGSGIFKSDNPAKRARAIVEAVENYRDPKVLVKVSKNLGEAMRGHASLKINPK